MFHYTSWDFYAFSGTNLLTSCHSASSLFSTIFVFQKSYTGNILRIGRNQSQSSRYFTELPENRRGDGVGPRGGLTPGRRGPALGHTPYVWGCLGPLLTMPLRLLRPPDGKNLSTRSIFQKHIAICRRRRPEIERVQKLFLTPYRRGESPPEVFFIAMLASGAMSE
jgi:hypothetical protein